jgi:DNA-binding transcriptional regulator PaaX
MLKEIILEILRNFKWMATNVVFTDYCTSYKNLRRYIYYGGRPPRIRKEEEKADWQRKERQRFYNLLYYLKKQGFIEKKSNENKKGSWRLTLRGLQYLKNLKSPKHKKSLLSLKPKDIAKKDYLKVVVFDVPENKKEQRNWLRQTLINFNFSILQKSVLVGETQLPEDFFHSLKEMGLLPYIHIFAVNKEKTGSLFNL